MPATLKVVKKIIIQEFPGADVKGIREDRHRILDEIVWDGFKDKDSRTRQQLISDTVRERLGSKGINVGILIPLTPGETL